MRWLSGFFTGVAGVAAAGLLAFGVELAPEMKAMFAEFRGTLPDATALVTLSSQALHREWVVRRGRVRIEQRLQRAVVGAGRHREAIADLVVLATVELPPLALEVEHRSLVLG